MTALQEKLTKREFEVAERLVHGWDNKEIAVKLGVSHRTVEEHRAAIFKKVAVRNAVELVRAFYGIEDVR